VVLSEEVAWRVVLREEEYLEHLFPVTKVEWLVFPVVWEQEEVPVELVEQQVMSPELVEEQQEEVSVELVEQQVEVLSELVEQQVMSPELVEEAWLVSA
jgi:hypothetical protein|tara:strand:- start:398 stop:694 length:297 start_codon:yes stop_codon:yes gene_type:complete